MTMHRLDIAHDNGRRIERILEIVAEYRAGRPIASIVRKYGISPGYIGNLRRRFDLPKRRPGLIPEVREKVAKAYADGVPIKEIVERYGVDRKTVWIVAKDSGLQLRQQHRKPAKAAEIRAFFAEGGNNEATS
jgi:uncharacterized protein YjcR